MKMLYEELELEVIRFTAGDILTTSDAAAGDNGNTNTNDNSSTDNSGNETPWTSGLFVHFPGELARPESHQLTPAGEDHGYPRFIDENGCEWFLSTDGMYYIYPA